MDSSRFPIAKTITGVVLDLDSGALRTLHWHPNADEWQYVLDGTVSVTLFGSHGRTRIEQLQQGDVGYIPKGYGHSIENTGDKPARIPIVEISYVSTPRSKSSSKRRCLTLRPRRRTSFRASIPILMCVST